MKTLEQNCASLSNNSTHKVPISSLRSPDEKETSRQSQFAFIWSSEGGREWMWWKGMEMTQIQSNGCSLDLKNRIKRDLG